jgi:hypothetical protein
MTIATSVAALLEPTFGRPGPQPMGAVLGLAPIAGPVAGPVAGLADPATGCASHIIDIIGLLASLTDNQVDALAPVDRRLLRDQLERVHRVVAGATILNEARPAAASGGGEPRCGKAAFLDELRDGRGRE